MNSVARLAAEVRARRLSKRLGQEMARRKLVAVTLRGPEAAVPRYFGDNAGARPIKIGTTTIWRDEIGRKCDLEHYIAIEHRTLVRLWVFGERRAARLADALRGHLLAGGAEMRNGWIDVGTDLDLDRLYRTCLDVATAADIDAWTDAGIVSFVEELHRHEMLMREIG